MQSSSWYSVLRYAAIFSFILVCSNERASAHSRATFANSGAYSDDRPDLDPTFFRFEPHIDLMEMKGLQSETASAEGGSTRSDDERGGGPFHRMTNYIGDHIALDLGAGFNAPIGNDIPYVTWGGNFTVGGGVHLNKRASILAEYQFIDDKLPGGLIAEAGTQGGHAHVWSFTLDPVIDLLSERTNSIYVTGGGGFYRKVTSFTEPGEYQNYVVGHFSSNQGGVSFGFGVTHKMRWETNMRVYAEARYLFLNTPPITATNGLGTTELIPVTIGVRW